MSHAEPLIGLPALPVVFLRVGLDGLGKEVVTEPFLDFPVNTFRYLYVGFRG